MIRLALALALLAGCEYRRDLGDTVGDPLLAVDAGDDVGGATCDTFELELTDCTTPGSSCFLDDGDCAAGQKCNAYLGRCYVESPACRGTQCERDDDCGAGLHCNFAVQVCIDPTESQVCMGCAFDDDCGPGEQCELLAQKCVR